jgi:hypothetical protein
MLRNRTRVIALDSTASVPHTGSSPGQGAGPRTRNAMELTARTVKYIDAWTPAIALMM